MNVSDTDMEGIGMPILTRAPWASWGSALCYLSLLLHQWAPLLPLIHCYESFTDYTSLLKWLTEACLLSQLSQTITSLTPSNAPAISIPINKLWIVCHLCDGFATSLVSSLHLWTHILGTTGIYFPQAQLSEVEEMAFMCSGKGQRGLACKEAPKNGRNRRKYSCGMLPKPQCCCWTAFNLHYCSWHPFTGSINLPLIMLHYLTESCLECWYFLHAIQWLGSIAGWAQKSPGKPPTAKALSGYNACTSSSGSCCMSNWILVIHF